MVSALWNILHPKSSVGAHSVVIQEVINKSIPPPPQISDMQLLPVDLGQAPVAVVISMLLACYSAALTN